MTRAIDAAYAVKDVWGNTGPSERELILRSGPRMFSSPCATKLWTC